MNHCYILSTVCVLPLVIWNLSSKQSSLFPRMSWKHIPAPPTRTAICYWTQTGRCTHTFLAGRMEHTQTENTKKLHVSTTMSQSTAPEIQNTHIWVFLNKKNNKYLHSNWTTTMAWLVLALLKDNKKFLGLKSGIWMDWWLLEKMVHCHIRRSTTASRGSPQSKTCSCWSLL